ncbi:histidine phosphatase family protein [Streptomyces sp. NPDC097704]|uniref:histidine phosphatase family protein n=1 Tax=Streptomyces sp. NPDC097704 TaxID=3157101 RepID=UPI0033210F6E
MTETAARYLYLARHGEATEDESALTDDGRRQAVLLGERLRKAPLTAIHHGPLARAEETARLVGEQLDGVPLRMSAPAGDYIPYTPLREELPARSADAMLGFLARFPAEEREQGPALAAEALARFTGPVGGDQPRHELVVTHNFLLAWLVREALEAPKARWMGINHANAALTVIRYAPDRAPAVLFLNDQRHLPADLCWTGFPPEFHI